MDHAHNFNFFLLQTNFQVQIFDKIRSINQDFKIYKQFNWIDGHGSALVDWQTNHAFTSNKNSISRFLWRPSPNFNLWQIIKQILQIRPGPRPSKFCLFGLIDCEREKSATRLCVWTERKKNLILSNFYYLNKRNKKKIILYTRGHLILFENCFFCVVSLSNGLWCVVL